MKKENNYIKPNRFAYRIAQIVCNAFARVVFRRKIIRNEIKKTKGAYIVIANHQAQLDFVNLIGVTKRYLTFVISNSFYNSLPIKGFLKALGVIPKQQFQTEYKDIKKIKGVIDSDNPLVIYPAGLMTENGTSTPIPIATNKLLKMLNVDVYVARSYGTYFSMPKWSKKIRRGRTYIDIYKLIGKEELQKTSLEELSEKIDQALLFDAYTEQEKLMIKYEDNSNIKGLENVLYKCPHCGEEFSMNIVNNNTIYCEKCGFKEVTDEFGFLHNNDKSKEIRYVPEWDYIIFSDLKKQIESAPNYSLSDQTTIQMIDYKKHKFVDVGMGVLTLNKEGFVISGKINEENVTIAIPMKIVPSLPFKPGKYIEIQQGSNIYRCVLHHGRLAMKFIHCVQAFYEINNKVIVKKYKKPTIRKQLIS